MNIDDQKIKELAHLARLEFNDYEREEIKKDLNNIVAFCDKLREVNTDGQAALVYISDSENVLREDIVEQSLNKSEALKNAPSKDSDYFKVPKVIKKS